jgi:hypothetical protein
MKNPSQPAKGRRSDGEFYRAFLSLDRERRRRVALRILQNQRVLSDLYDHFLIQEALREPGKRTLWRDYLAKETSPRH